MQNMVSIAAYQNVSMETLATRVPVGAALHHLPLLDAFERPLRANCHAHVVFPVGIEALGGSRAFGSHGPAGVKDPFFGCISEK